MNKKEYLAELERRLKTLPADERKDALEYYEGYLNDAGRKYKQAIAELGTPKEVAAKILAESAVKESETKDSSKATGSPKTALAVVLAIFAAPIALPLAIAAFSVIFALLVTLFALIVAFGASGVGMLVGSLAFIPISIVTLTQNAPVGLAVLGSACVLLGLGSFFLAGAIGLARAGFGGIARLAGKTILRKKEA